MQADSTMKMPAPGRRAAGQSRNDLAGERLAREWRTMTAMVRLYCRMKHESSEELCPDCQAFLAYAQQRLERCQFGPEKPTCARCPVHCYQRDRREQARTIMRQAGPWMLWRHPVLSVFHWLDGRRPAPTVRGNSLPSI